MTCKGRTEAVINKEDNYEACCFVCKDGGALLKCDYKDCLKCFHPFCVKKDDSILESQEKWMCNRHTCFYCSSSSTYLCCYTCTESVCRDCLPTADFFQIKGKYGFCGYDLKVVLLIEEQRDYLDGKKVDFTDWQTVEYFFKLYYHNLKDREGFELKDLYAAVERAKMKKEHQSTPCFDKDEEEEDEENEDWDSEYNATDDENYHKILRTENRSRGKKSSRKSNKKQKTYHGNASTEPPQLAVGQVEEIKSEREEFAPESKYYHRASSRATTDDESFYKRHYVKKRSKIMNSTLNSCAKEKTHHGNASIEPPQLTANHLVNKSRSQEIEVIELLDSDEEAEKAGKFDDVESYRWCLRGPCGDGLDMCSLNQLRDWNRRSAKLLKFKVWRDDEDEKEAIWLREALNSAFPVKYK